MDGTSGEARLVWDGQGSGAAPGRTAGATRYATPLTVVVASGVRPHDSRRLLALDPNDAPAVGLGRVADRLVHDVVDRLGEAEEVWADRLPRQGRVRLLPDSWVEGRSVEHDVTATGDQIPGTLQHTWIVALAAPPPPEPTQREADARRYPV